MSDDLIRYDILTQEALRKVIRKVLEEVQRTGLPGDHHFFITFETTFPGVRLSNRMREKYPEEMTIVIQHSYWNLEVEDTGFEIDLSFDDIRERLRVPFASIRGFFDPAVKFGLQFDPSGAGESSNAEDAEQSISQENRPADSAKQPGGMPAIKPGEDEAGDEDDGEKEEAGADVVSLDSFRKKK